jgi:FkbM family methyltransferase
MSVLTRVASTVSGRLGRRNPIISRLRPAYEVLLELASGGKGTSWSVHGEPLRIDPRVRRLVNRAGEPELFDYLKANVGPGDIVFDIGSFLGAYAIVMARWTAPSGRVIAFEPTPDVAKTLARHLRINGVAERVSLQTVALGERAGAVSLHKHSDPYRNAVGVTDPAGVADGAVSVPMKTLDEVCDELGVSPTFIRMDVQGLEYAILRGARRTIARQKGRLRIVLEVHPQLWPMHGVDATGFDTLLAELGLRARPLIADEPLYTPDGHVLLEYV